MIKFENKENGRYFYITVEHDYSKRLVIRVIRGGRNVCVTRNVFLSETMDEIEKEIARISQRRIRRGYCLVT